jgi:hypothetical protein
MGKTSEISSAIRMLGPKGAEAAEEILKLAHSSPEIPDSLRGAAQHYYKQALMHVEGPDAVVGAVNQLPGTNMGIGGGTGEVTVIPKPGEGPVPTAEALQGPKAAYAAAPVAAMGVANAKSPLDYIKEGVNAYEENVAEPIANAVKSRLTPDINVQGQTYKTASPVSDFAIEQASNPVNYAEGPVGVGLQAAEMVGKPEYADGGSVGFDPDAYIANNLPSQGQAQPQASGSVDPNFDPDAYIKQLQESKYGTPGQQGIAGVEALGRGVAGPISTYIEKELPH